MGLVVVGTTRGGSGELLLHEKTGLAFEAGNSRSLATQLERLLVEPDLAARLAAAGRRTVCESFNIDLTVERIEQYLRGVCENQP